MVERNPSTFESKGLNENEEIPSLLEGNEQTTL